MDKKSKNSENTQNAAEGKQGEGFLNFEILTLFFKNFC